MPTLNMGGPFDLTHEEIDRKVTKKSAGNYALGKLNDQNGLLVFYVGRSDDDLNARLHDWVGKYPKFMASYAETATVAFQKECRNFHDYEPPDNDCHPDQPNGVTCACPHCSPPTQVDENRPKDQSSASSPKPKPPSAG